MNNHLEAKLALLNTQIDEQLEANQRGIARADELLDAKGKLLDVLSQIELPAVNNFDLIVSAIEGNEAIMFGTYRLKYDNCRLLHYYQHPMRVTSEHNPMITVDPYDYQEIIDSNTIILLKYL